MKKYLFKPGKNIYKANLHCHTTLSDGNHTPQQIKDMYKHEGYSIVAFTDHSVLKNHSYLNDEDFLALTSCEVDVNQHGQPWNNTKVYHFNLYATNSDTNISPPPMQMAYDDIDAINKYIRDRVNEGYLVCYNHPFWSLQTYEDYARLKGCFAMEIYNHGCEVEGYYGYNPQVYDEMLRAGGPIFCVSTDDNHNWQDDSFGGYVMIGAESLEYGAVIDALKQGNFYSSQGPEIYEISIENSKLYIECSDVELIHVYTDGRRCYSKTGDNINQAAFDLDGDEKYVRVMCRDRQKRDANTNAYWL